MTQIQVGNVGALTNGVQGLWIVDTIWQTDEVLILHSLEDETKQTEAYIDEFWPLLDSFAH